MTYVSGNRWATWIFFSFDPKFSQSWVIIDLVSMHIYMLCRKRKQEITPVNKYIMKTYFKIDLVILIDLVKPKQFSWEKYASYFGVEGVTTTHVLLIVNAITVLRATHKPSGGFLSSRSVFTELYHGLCCPTYLLIAHVPHEKEKKQLHERCILTIRQEKINDKKQHVNLSTWTRYIQLIN